MRCEICPHRCDIQEGKNGLCHAWTFQEGALTSLNYGQVTSLALDPIEKKPLYHFYPGSRILSIGSFGCNLNCPWCQNDSISRGEAKSIFFTPDEIVQKATELVPDGNIGIAFTYNEPMICPDFIVDTAKRAKEEGLKTVLVTNGMITAKAHERFLPFIDAYNIDLKTAYASSYRSIGGDLDAILDTIRRARENAHVEATTLIVPGFNDTEKEICTIAQLIAQIDPAIVLHVTRFFPAGRMRDVPPTDVKKVYHFAEIAREYLTSVYTGNC